MKKDKKQIKSICVVITAILFVSGVSSSLFSHCEIPCGIYDDPMRIDMISENIKTIEKAMLQIQGLEKEGNENNNQIVRWVMNKEHHADQLSEVVTQYFMKQRMMPIEDVQSEGYAKYTHQLVLLHKLMVYSMKCKQTTDLEYVDKLKQTLAQFRSSYLGETGDF